jgi:hypothetical protein
MLTCERAAGHLRMLRASLFPTTSIIYQELLLILPRGPQLTAWIRKHDCSS